MAQIIPWSEFEAEYAQNFPTDSWCTRQILSEGIGGINYQKKLLISDRITVEHIRETT